MCAFVNSAWSACLFFLPLFRIFLSDNPRGKRKQKYVKIYEKTLSIIWYKVDNITQKYDNNESEYSLTTIYKCVCFFTKLI